MACFFEKEFLLTIEEAFGTVIRRLRKGRFLSQDELSALSSLDRVFISRRERGKQQPTLITIFELAAALRVTVVRMLAETELLLSLNKVKISKQEVGLDSFAKLWAQLGANLMSVLPNLRGTETILLVDDEMLMLNFLSELLKNHGYSVITAQDGQEAVDKYYSNVPNIDFVLMDIMMPRLDGISAYKAISVMGSKTPVLLMTGYSAFSLGDLDNLQIINKPFSPGNLLSHIRGLLDITQDV
jgi:CheY-like chemotaxis protein/DNA-binding XRE family transcriptional regulator